MAKILIVDDSSLSRRFMRGILEPAGHHVSEVSDGLAALERYFLDRPDLVLLDLAMSGLSGLEVLVQLKELAANVRVVVATADIQTSTKVLAQAAGAHSLITKPFVPEQVLDAVNAALRAPERQEKGAPQ